MTLSCPFIRTALFVSTLSLAAVQKSCQSNQISHCPEGVHILGMTNNLLSSLRINSAFRGKVLGQLVAKPELICLWVKGRYYHENCHLPAAFYGTGALNIYHHDSPVKEFYSHFTEK